MQENELEADLRGCVTYKSGSESGGDGRHKATVRVSGKMMQTFYFNKADVAQLVEQPIRNRQVTSSTLVVGSILSNTYWCFSLHPQVTVTWIVT